MESGGSGGLSVGSGGAVNERFSVLEGLNSEKLGQKIEDEGVNL